MYNNKLVKDLDKRKLFKTNKFHDDNKEEYYWDDYDTQINTPGIKIKTYITPLELMKIHETASPTTKFIYNKITNRDRCFIEKLVLIYNSHIKTNPIQHTSTQTGYYHPVIQSQPIKPCSPVKQTQSIVCHEASTQTDNPLIPPHPEYYYPGTNNYFSPFFANFKIAK